MKRLATILFALAAPLLVAQETTRKLVELKYVNANQVQSLLRDFQVTIRSDDRLKTVVLSGWPDNVAQVEAAIKKLDVPPPPAKNIELLAYLVMASNEPQTGAEPVDLSSAIKQMRSLFPYKSYQLLDTIWVRLRENQGIETEGLAPKSLKINPNYDPHYTLTANNATISSSEPKTVRFEHLNLRLILNEFSRGTSPSSVATVDVRINSSFDVREGQKVVIGKTNPTGADSAIVLVVTAKVVE